MVRRRGHRQQRFPAGRITTPPWWTRPGRTTLGRRPNTGDPDEQSDRSGRRDPGRDGASPGRVRPPPAPMPSSVSTASRLPPPTGCSGTTAAIRPRPSSARRTSSPSAGGSLPANSRVGRQAPSGCWRSWGSPSSMCERRAVLVSSTGGDVDELWSLFLLEKLTDEQLGLLCDRGRVEATGPGVIFRAGDPAHRFYVLLDGTISPFQQGRRPRRGDHPHRTAWSGHLQPAIDVHHAALS